jgi:hypothetical protein
MKNLNKKIDNILNLSSEKKYDYFIRKVCDFEEVWGLYENGWAMVGDKEEKKSIAFWPEKDFAILCKSNEWKNYEPKSIELSDFLDKWIPGLKNDNLTATIFYMPNGKGIIVESEKLENDLNTELQQYK